MVTKTVAKKTNTPASKANTPAKASPPQEEAKAVEEETTTQVVKAGRWDTLAYWVVILLMAGDKNLEESGVTTTMVGTFLQEITPQVFSDLQGVGAIPQGVTIHGLKVTPLKGVGSWERILANTLWRMCPSKVGDKQAGGGKYTPALLERHSTQRPVTFTLAK